MKTRLIITTIACLLLLVSHEAFSRTYETRLWHVVHTSVLFSTVRADSRAVALQQGTAIGYALAHQLTPALSYGLGVTMLTHGATAATAGYGYPGYTALSASGRVQARIHRFRESGWTLTVGLYAGGAAQLAQLAYTRLYFFYPSVEAGVAAVLCLEAVPGARFFAETPARYDFRNDMTVAAGGGLRLGMQVPLFPATQGPGGRI